MGPQPVATRAVSPARVLGFLPASVRVSNLLRDLSQYGPNFECP